MANFDMLGVGENVEIEEIDWETLQQIFDGEFDTSTSKKEAGKEMKGVLNPIKTEETLLKDPDSECWKKRFKSVSDTELQELKERRQSKATKFNTKCGVNLFQGLYMKTKNMNLEAVCYVTPEVLKLCDGTFDQGINQTGYDGSENVKKGLFSGTSDVSCQKVEEKKRKLVQDLVDSETDYVCDLKDLIENYIDPAEEEDFPATFIKREKEIFRNVEALYKFHHRELLPELLASGNEPEKVAEVFLKKRESFSEYLPFMAGKGKAGESMDSAELRKFLQEYSKSIGDDENTLDDLLSRPVERIHEYMDLLKNLVKFTKAGGGDCTELMSAIGMLSEICREVENIILLDNMEGCDKTTLGPVLCHETVVLWKSEAEEGEECHIFLFPEKLVVAKEIEDTKYVKDSNLPRLKFEQAIELKTVGVYDDVTDDWKCLELWDVSQDVKCDNTPTSSLTLQTSSPYSKQTLVRDIQEAQEKLGIKREKPTNMPEHKKLTTKTQKIKSSKLKRTEQTGDNESIASSDDFKLIDTSHDIMTPEFEDGTTRPIFKRKLKKTVIAENSMARLECLAIGIPQPKVLWLKNNRPLTSTDSCHVMSEGNLHILEFPKAKKEDTGLYTARAMNVNGSTISSAELLVGNAQPSSLKKYKEGLAEEEFQTPAYFFQMNNCQVEEGRLARFDCRVVAYPKPEITWMKDGKVVESGDRYKLLNFNNEIYSLLVQNVEKNDTGRYTCWAHNKYGEAMTEAYLNVIALEEQLEDSDIAPKFLTKFYDQTISDGLPAVFECMIAGKPQPAVRWLLNDIELKSSTNVQIQQQENICSLKIKEAKVKDAGKYSCHLKNPLGEAVCSAGLTMLDQKIKGVPMLPKFLKRIVDATSTAGEEMLYEVVVVGEPKPKVTWLYNHKPISETHRRFRMSAGADTYSLIMSELRVEDEGKITCKAVNSEGEVYCSSNLVVKRAPLEIKDEKPSFTQKDFDAKYGCPPTFMKKMENIYSPEGKNAKFECKVMGIPEPTVTWYKNDKPLTPGSHYWINRDGGTCTLTVRDVMSSDTGQYTCKISNPAGETTCAAALNLDSMKVKEKSHDTEYSPFARRLSRDSIKSDHDAIPTLPYDKPSLTDIREESIRLSWLPAYTSSLPPEARNVKYVIEARELPGFDWHKVATGIHGNTHMLKNLKPNQEYAFRVHAENQYGASDSTQPAMLSRPKPAIEDEVMEKFYVKPHESRAPPKLPSTKPFVTEMGQETMRLAWKPAVAPIAAKKVAPISYRLEAQELPSTDWMPMANRLRDTSYYLPELKSDRDYNIRVRAENKYGQSEPSEPLWIPRATSFPGVPVTRPRIIEMEPDSVRVTWQKVEIPSFSADEEPLMYMLEMQEPPKAEWRQIARDIPDTSYMVRGLKPRQDYRFRVKARTPRGVFGEASPATSLYRTLATTRIPVDRLELEDAEPDFEGVRLSWNRVDIPPYHVDDQPLMYMVEMNEPPIDEWRPVVSGLPTTRYRVTDLLPDRDYRFRVRAVTPYGISPPSHTLPVSYRRPLPAPSRPLPEMPQLLYDDSDALKLSWKPPFIDTKRPLKYQVQMQAPQSQDWRPLASGISDTSYRIRGLGPSRDYTFRIIPETSLGPLQALPPVSLTALPAPRTILPRRPDISDLQPESLRLTWKRPLIDSAVPLTYKIDIQEPPSREWRPIASNVPDTQYYVKGLRPNRDYLFRVTPSTPSYSMEPLPYVTLSSMPVRPNLYSQEPRAIEIGKDAVQLSWRPAEVPHFARQYHPLRYNVEMRTLPGSDWTIAARNLQETTYLVKGLRPEKEYQFRIRAQTDFGSSEPSLPVTIYRKTVPVFPRREPILTNLNSDSVVLSWQPATIPGSVSHMPFVTYRIEVQDPPEIGHWRTYISSIPKTSYHVTNLRPDRDYLFRVRAEADGITTEPSLPVYLSRRACPPRMPQEQPYVFELRPESVKLQWRSVELPTRITDYSPVTYRLEIQESPRMEWMTLARGIPHTDFHVTNLNPDKDYRFRVRAENDMGISDPTPEVSIRKRAVPPSLPQEEPLIYDIGPSGFWLSWRPADLSSYQSDSPVTYTIYIQEPPSSTWRPLVRRIPHAFYHVTNLRNDRDYNFRIQAENEFGLSRPTLPLKLFGCKEWKAPIDLPEITDIDESTRSLRLKWHPKPLAPFDKEAVRYHVESWEPKQRSWKSIAKGIPDTSFKVTGLPLEQDHLFRIRAEAEKVLSEPTYPISLNRFRLPAHFPIPRPQLYDVEPDAVRLSWQPTHRTNLDKPISLPKRYRLELRELPSLNWRPVAHDIPDTSYRITGLKPKQDYEFRVQGLTDKGPSTYTAPISLYRRPVIPRIPVDGPRIVDVKDDYVDLRWRLVDIPSFSHSEEPLAFLIEAQTPPRYDWTPVARNVAGTSYRVQNLQRHQDYVFRVRAEYPSGLSEPSPYIPVYRRPSELIPCHGSALTALTSSHNVLVVAPLVSTNKISPAINSKKEYFLREMARLDKQRKEFNEKLHKIKSNAIKPLTSTKSLKEKFIADMAMTAKPPPSPRSRRDKFLIDKKSSATKIQPVEKKVDFGKALDKFRVLEASFGPAKPTVYRRDYSQSTGQSVDSSVLPRRLSLDSRAPIKTPALSSTLSSVHDTKMPSKHFSPSRPRMSFISTDDSFLGSRRSMSYSTTDLSYKKRHLVPDRLKYGQMSTDLSYKKLVRDYEFIPKSSYKPISSFHKDTPLYDSKYKSFERKYYFPRPHSWAGRDITSKSAHTKYGNKYSSDIYSSTSHRRSSVSTYSPGDYRKGSLSLIGQSIYHDRYAHSSSLHTPTYRSASYDVERRARSFSREMSVISKYDYGGQSTRKYSTSSLSRDRSSSSTHTNLGRNSSKYTSSSLSRDRISSSVGPNFGGSRRYSMSTDIYSVRSGYDKTRDWSISPDRYSTTISGVSAHSPVRSSTRSPSRATTRSPSRAKTFDSLSQRSGSIPESGYMSRTSSLPYNSYLPSRSSSVTQTVLSRSGSTTGSVTDSPLRLKPRSSSAILTGLPPMSKITPSSSKKKDVSVSYTSYLPPTKQSLAQKAKSSGSRDSLLSADSSPSRMTRTSTPTKSTTPCPPGRDLTPTKGRDLTPVRIRTGSTSSTGSEKKVKKSSHTSKKMESVDKHAINVEPPKVQVEESVDEEKLAWLHAPSSHTIKHLA